MYGSQSVFLMFISMTSMGLIEVKSHSLLFIGGHGRVKTETGDEMRGCLNASTDQTLFCPFFKSSYFNPNIPHPASKLPNPTFHFLRFHPTSHTLFLTSHIPHYIFHIPHPTFTSHIPLTSHIPYSTSHFPHPTFRFP